MLQVLLYLQRPCLPGTTVVKIITILGTCQLVRWVNNKEEHAKKIQDIVSQYFLHQRIKLTDPEDKVVYAKYQKHLGLLHQMLVYSMKAKQTTDQMYIDKLRKAIHNFEDAYFHKH